MISELNHITVSLVSFCAVSVSSMLRCCRDWSGVGASLNLTSLRSSSAYSPSHSKQQAQPIPQHSQTPSAITSRSHQMEVTAKPGADLLWAFQLHREHRALAKRLTAVETSAAHQQERITASEQNAHSDQHGRVDALTERLRKLEDADVSEQVAGLAGELRVTRQQLEQARDKLKAIEKAGKEADGKNKDKEREIQVRLGEFASVVAQTQNAVHALEGRLGLAVDAAGRSAADGLAAFSERYEEQLGTLSGKLRSLERVQGDLHALFETDRRNRIAAPVVSAPTGPEAAHITERRTTLSEPSHTQSRTKPPRSKPEAIPESPAQERIAADMPEPQRPSRIMPPVPKTPALAEQKSTVSSKSKSKRKRGFEKEISQLIHGDGFLTNAPIILESQAPGATTRGNKKLKTLPVEGRSLRSDFTQPDAPINNIKKEPAMTRAKASAQTAMSVVAGRKTAAKTVAKRSVPTPATAATQERKGEAKPKKTPAPKKPLPSTSSEVQVAHSRTPSTPRQPLQPPSLEVSSVLPKIQEKNTTKQQEQRSKPRRRRIEQDDSMEEFLAKCEAATEMEV